MMKLLIGAVLLAAGLYLILAATLFVLQRRLIYHPEPESHTPAQAGLGGGVDELRLDTPDGARLLAWRAWPQSGRPTILYFHGNAGGLIDRAERIRRFTHEGYGVFMAAYRGYAGSTGSPSEAALVADARLAYDRLIADGIAPRDIVAYGESLGTGVAVQLAISREVGAVVLDAPYTGLAEIGQQIYPWLPVRLFLRDKFASIEHIVGLRAPLLILHGSRDTTIPVTLGRALFQAAPEPKRMHILNGAGHSDIYAHGAMPLLRRFLEEHIPRAAMRSP